MVVSGAAGASGRATRGGPGGVDGTGATELDVSAGPTVDVAPARWASDVRVVSQLRWWRLRCVPADPEKVYDGVVE